MQRACFKHLATAAADLAFASDMICCQGIACAVESVRVLNLALKATKDNLARAPMVYSEVRLHGVHRVTCTLACAQCTVCAWL